MITEYFEKMLMDTHKSNPDAEAMWDSRAAQFSQFQQEDRTEFPDKTTKLLMDNGYLTDNATILDIGGGTGRYAIPFAKAAKSVTITDLSSGMLEHAKANAGKNGIYNIKYEKLDWDNTEIDGSKYEKSHDIVFASMCPAVRSKSGIMKMISAAKKVCVINQFIKMGDSRKTDGYDPHNDRGTVQATFNILWELGFNVRLAYHTYQDDTGSAVLATIFWDV